VASIVWFRRDLRLHDHPALTAALRRGEPMIPMGLCACRSTETKPTTTATGSGSARSAPTRSRRFGRDYPTAMVDHSEARQHAL